MLIIGLYSIFIMAIKAGTLDTPHSPKSMLYVIRQYCGAVCSLCSQQYNIERWGWEGGELLMSQLFLSKIVVISVPYKL